MSGDRTEQERRRDRNINVVLIFVIGFSSFAIGYAVWILNQYPYTMKTYDQQNRTIITVQEPLIDAQLGYTLILIEVPVEVIFTVIIYRLLESQQRFRHSQEELRNSQQQLINMAQVMTQTWQNMQDRDRNIQNLTSLTRNHDTIDIAPILSASWFGIGVISGHGESHVDHEIRGASAVYWVKRGIRITPLSEPRSTGGGSVENTIEHLRRGYGVEWDQWIALKTDVNNHLIEIENTWNELEKLIEDVMTNRCSGLRKIVDDDKETLVVNSYNLRRLLIMMWKESLMKSDQKHIWEDDDYIQTIGIEYKLGEWAFCGSKASLESLQKCVSTIFTKSDIAIKRSRLERARESLVERCKQFEDFLKEPLAAHNRGELIAGTCVICENWRGQLSVLTAPPNR